MSLKKKQVKKSRQVVPEEPPAVWQLPCPKFKKKDKMSLLSEKGWGVRPPGAVAPAVRWGVNAKKPHRQQLGVCGCIMGSAVSTECVQFTLPYSAKVLGKVCPCRPGSWMDWCILVSVVQYGRASVLQRYKPRSSPGRSPRTGRRGEINLEEERRGETFKDMNKS